ncbi:MAG: phosphoesterase [Proteobacteria bacterium]|nr:phosphoesterase [Pseudomonadota bacterium]
MTDPKKEMDLTQVDRRQAITLGSGLALAAAGFASPRGFGATALNAFQGIDTVVVLMMENRSFDHVFGDIRNDPTYPSAAQIDALRGGEANVSLLGQNVPSYHLGRLIQSDPPHGWEECRAQWNGGKNDGFVRAHSGLWEREAMGFYRREDMPVTYWLADHYTVCDRWFSSVLGPTWPNRAVLHATNAAGLKYNRPYLKPPTTIWETLAPLGKTAKNYFGGAAPFYAGAFLAKLLAGINPLASLSQFFDDAKNGCLPNFAVVDPDFSFNDDHPSHNVHLGQALISSVYQAMAASPQWERSLLIITYDEHGGFYDHVPPPTCSDDDPEYRQLGFRVPTLVIGPTVRRGAVCSEQFEHSSVAATLAAVHGLPNLTKRMARSANLSACIDPAAVGAPRQPAPGAPVVTLDPLDMLLASPPSSSQPELEAMLASGEIPANLIDGRSRETRTADWLETAASLGTVSFR